MLIKNILFNVVGMVFASFLVMLIKFKCYEKIKDNQEQRDGQDYQDDIAR